RWSAPPYANFSRRRGAAGRVVTFGPRGLGSSDRASGDPLPSWERWVDDARAVLDTAGSARAVLFGVGNHGPIVTLFAASHPTRTRGLILANALASASALEPEAPDTALR